MCEIVGVTKVCEVYYVHIGYMDFGKRHFIALIDNIVVDVGDKPNSPWGQANIKLPIFRITKYPNITLPREY